MTHYRLGVGERARIVSLLGAFCVVLIHMVDHPWRLDVAIATQWAVPWFLFLSGVYFRASLGKYSALHILVDKSVKLLLPYFIFALYGLIVTVLSVKSYSEAGGLFKVLGVSSPSPLYNQPLWFLRSLYLYAMICLIGWRLLQWLGVSRNAGIMILVVYYLCVICILARTTNLVPMPASPFYFILGLLRSNKFLYGGELVSERSLCMTALVLIVASILLRYWCDPGCLEFVEPTWSARLVRNITSMFTAYAVWALSGCLLSTPVVRAIIDVSSSSMFVYLCHFPVVVAIKRSAYIDRICNSSWLAVLLAAVLVALIVLIWRVLRYRFPRFLTFLQGGRS